MIEPEQPQPEPLPSRRAAREGGARSRPDAAGAAEAEVVATTELAGSTEFIETTESAEPTKPSGIAAFIKRHPRAVLTTALSVAFLLLSTGALFAGVAVGSANAVAPVPIITATPTPEPDPRALPATIADPSRLRTCSIDALSLDERITTLYGSVINASTGELLWDRQATTPVQTASVLKLLTGAVALSALGPDFRLSTRVVAGSTPGSVVLIGGGDPTLSRLPAGQESVYPGAPKLQTLAEQTVAAYTAANPDAPEITEVVLDSTYWGTGDRWDPSWDRSLQTIGYASEVTALQVDGDRDDPRQAISPRSTDPIGRAGVWFAEALAAAGNPGGTPTLSQGAAVGSTVLAEVQSQPVSSLVAFMIDTSDNAVAEALARVSSRSIGQDGSAASFTRTFTGVLSTYGPSTTGISIRDGSGLSALNAIPAQYVAELLIQINGGAQNLSIINGALSVAGVNGNLRDRFTGPNAVARGNVSGKVGWIGSAYTLAGVVRAADGSVLTYAFFAVREGIARNARDGLDSLTTGVFSCGDNLSNN